MTKNVKMAQKWPKMAQSRRKWSGLVKMVKKWVRDGEDGPKGAKRAIKKKRPKMAKCRLAEKCTGKPRKCPHHPSSPSPP